MPSLSKKTVLAGLQCHKRLWWQVHEPSAEEMRESLIVQFRLREGSEVGQLARRYVPGGHLIERGERSAAALVAETRAALSMPAIPAIYEGAFSAMGVTVYTDILERVDGGWALIEVKATTSLSETEHIPDIAVQACVLRKCGVPVVRYEIMHLNRECSFPDLSNLFTREDVSDAVRGCLDDLEREIVAQQLMLAAAEPPVVSTGAHCAKPHECPFMGRCWAPLPEHHVSTLYRIGSTKAESFVSSGWHTIHDLPDSVKLSATAARQRRAVRQGAMIVERESLVEALGLVDRPVAHIDFETVGPAIPRWDGCRPYDQIPVQMSAHIVHADGTTTHREWLYDGDGDPRPEAARAILDACRGARTVTAYYAQFEQGCIRRVALAAPGDAAELNAIADRIVDLLPIVREHVYHPAFAGSFSLKKVLPALVPELSYEGMAIGEGETAQVQLTRLLFDRDMNEEERRDIRDALLRYCELDTYAMVALENRLRDLAQ